MTDRRNTPFRVGEQVRFFPSEYAMRHYQSVEQFGIPLGASVNIQSIEENYWLVLENDRKWPWELFAPATIGDCPFTVGDCVTYSPTQQQRDENNRLDERLGMRIGDRFEIRRIVNNAYLVLGENDYYGWRWFLFRKS